MTTEGTLAHVAVSNTQIICHFTAQCQIYGRRGVDLDRCTLESWCGTAVDHLAPVVDRMLVQLKRFAACSWTRPEHVPRSQEKSGYLWALARDDRGWGGAVRPPSSSPMRPGARAAMPWTS